MDDWGMGRKDSSIERAREARRVELRAEIERLQGRIARTNDAKTRERLAVQIQRAQGRLSRA